MNAEVDWNKVIAQVFIDLAKSTVKTASGTLSSAIASLLHAFQKDLNPYLLSTLKRCSSVRTLLHRDQPVFLTSIYVKTYLKIGKRKIDDDYFIESLPKIENALIIGTAGSGKSFFLKYLFLALFELRRGKIPLFIELRQMNSMQTRDLILFMYHSVITPGGVITQDQFQQALKEGLFTIILDGFDEIEFDWRPDLEKQIFKLQESHPQNQFLISSRPDERFSAWHNFSIFHIQPMAKKEVLSLVRKIDYEQDVKKRFIKAIRSGMYEKRQLSFDTSFGNNDAAYL
jgi:predicted NACHT family NTPase